MGVIMSLLLPVAVPPAVVIEIVPVTAPGIIIATKTLPVLDTTIALCPPMVNTVGVPRFVPFMVTNVPTGPVAGLKEVMVGVAANNLTGEFAASNKVTINRMDSGDAYFNCLAGTAAGGKG